MSHPKALKLTEDLLNELEAIRGRCGVLENQLQTVWEIYKHFLDQTSYEDNLGLRWTPPTAVIPVPFNFGLIGPNENRSCPATVMMAFRPERLLLESAISPDLRVTALTCSQPGRTDDDVYELAREEGGEFVWYSVSGPSVVPGSVFTMSIENDGGGRQQVNVTMIGRAVDTNETVPAGGVAGTLFG